MRRATWVIALGLLVLAACGEQHSDLRQFVKESDNLPRGRIPPLPEVKPYEAVTYNAFDLVDPFTPRKVEPPKGASGGRGLQPDFNRRKEPLEAYPLENLRMVGVLQQNRVSHALIKAPDNNVYRVRAGNYLGQNFGRIVSVTDTTVELKEIVQDSTGSWEEKDQTLQLQE
jgi:type IV pilus assembly protein PilP